MEESVNQPIAIVDIETTGSNVDQTDDIIQLAAWIIQPDGTIDEQMTYVKPNGPIPATITELTGIDENTVADANRLEDIIEAWYHRLKPCILVAHNLAFDLSVLTTVFNRYHYAYKPKALDSVKLARIFLPTAPAFNLTDLSQYLSIQYADAHDALMDVRMTASLLQMMAQEVVKLPKKLRKQFQPWMQALSHDEVFFLDHPERFNFNIPIQYQKPAKQPKLSLHNNQDYLLGKWAYQQASQQSQLLLENPGQFVSQTTIKSLINQVNQHGQSAVILVADDRQAETVKAWIGEENAQSLFAADTYVHKTAFNRLLRDIKPTDVTERDRVIIIANAFWLSTSLTGHYGEINSELWAHEVFEKYVPKLLRHPNSFYHKAFKVALTSQNIIISYRAMLQLTNHQFRQLVDKKGKWIICQLDQLIEADRRHNQTGLGVSTFIRLQRRQLDKLYVATRKQEIAIGWTKKVLDLSHRISQLGQAILKKHWQKTGPTQQRVYLTKEKRSCLQALANQLLPLLNLQLSDLDGNENDQLLKGHLKNARAFCKQVGQLKSDQYLTVSGEKLNGDIYHIRFNCHSLMVSSKTSQRLKQMDYVGFLNGYGLKKEWGQTTAWLAGVPWHYQTLPKLTYKQPLQASCLPTYTALNDVDYSQHLKEIAQLLFKYIQRQRELNNSRLLIVATNEAQLDAVRQVYLNQSDKPYIYIEGMHGTIRRLKRRSIEKDDLVLIVSLASFIEEAWEPAHQFKHVTLMRLPFSHTQSPLMQAQGDYLKYDESQVFDQLVLPAMINRLRLFAQHCHQYMQVDTFNLLDDRVFTKYYAQKIQTLCASEIKFKILDE